MKLWLFEANLGSMVFDKTSFSVWTMLKWMLPLFSLSPFLVKMRNLKMNVVVEDYCC